MKKESLMITLIFVSFYTVGLSQTWTPRAPILTERWNPASVVLNGKIYVIGGQRGINPYGALPTVEMYDPETDTWEMKAPMLTPRWGLVAEVVNDKIYAIGGRGGSFAGGHYALDDVEEYDPQSDRWTSKTSMPTPRGWAGGVAINDTIFVFGGLGVQAEENVVEKYYPAGDSWKADVTMPQARSTFMTAHANGKVYLIGGWSSNLVQEYDSFSKTWTAKSPMPTPRGGSGIGVVHGRIYVVGGRGGNSNEFESYDPVHDRWTHWAPMPTRREGLTAEVVEDKLYAITGSVPLAEGGLPYLTANEEVSDFLRPLLHTSGYTIDDSEGNKDGVLTPGESANLIVLLENIGYAATDIRAELYVEDEHIIVQDGHSVYEEIEPFHPTGNTNTPFRLIAYPDFLSHWATAYVYVSEESDYADTLTFNFQTGHPFLLLVDDDGGSSSEEYYDACLYAGGNVYRYVDTQSKDCFCFDVSGYETMIWSTGDDRDSTLTPNEQTLIASYLERGGCLILFGQNIGYDLVENGSLDDALFYANYLHADYVNDTIEETFLTAVDGDPITGDFNLFTIDVNQTSPSVITPREGASSILHYYSSQEVAAIKYDGDYKLVYFALGLEGIRATTGDDDEIRGALLNNIVQWFNYVPFKGDVNQDGSLDILDVLAVVNIILGSTEPTESQEWAADCTGDGAVDIIDAIGIVNVVLGVGSCTSAETVKISSKVFKYFQSLESHFSKEDFKMLMTLVKEIYIPKEFILTQNYPNPFNARTIIEYALPHESVVKLCVFNILGREVATLVNDTNAAGHYRVTWDALDNAGNSLASGIYFYKLKTSDCSQTRKCLIMK